jgi:hypothetical protein
MPIVMLLLACDVTSRPVVTPGTTADTGRPPRADQPSGWPTDIPPVVHSPNTVRGHAEECAQVLGPIPGFDCIADGDPVPITVDGLPVDDTVGACDAPAMLDGSCSPHSRVGALQGRHEDGRDRPEVTFVFTCRSTEAPRPGDDGGRFHDVAMIGHNSQTGATCFFQSFPDGSSRVFPSPLAPAAEDVWQAPGPTADAGCHRCHAADPWIHSPWIDQVPSRDLPGVPVVPATVGNDTPYHVVGTAFADWQLAHFDLPDNGCTACHRIGAGACGGLVAYAVGDPSPAPLTPGVDGVPWMPPDPIDQTTWRTDADAILACCATPDDPACGRTAVPEGWRYIDPDPATPLPTPAPPSTPCGVPDADLGTALGTVVHAADTCGATADHPDTCGDPGAPDVALTWTAPAAGTYRFDAETAGHDAVIALHRSCGAGGGLLACDRAPGGQTSSSVTRTVAAGETLVVVLRGAAVDACGPMELGIQPTP